MNKYFLYSIVLLFAVACSSEEQKMQKVIKNYLYQTLDDYKSYEPIEFQPSDSIFSDWTMDPLLPKIEADYARMKKIADSLEVVNKRKAALGYSLDDITDDINMYILSTYYTTVAYSSKRDSIKNHYVSEFIGYGINHSFRANNRLGGTERHNYQFILNPNKTAVIMVNDIEAGEEITNHSKVLNKYELEEIERQELLRKNPNIKERGEAFLKDNQSKEGVIVTASGLQYRVIKEGEGRHPREKSKVQCKYTLQNIDGEFLDRQLDEPITILTDSAIKGFSEAIQLMTPGSKYEVCIPWDLAYGEKGLNDIPPYSVLIFNIELVRIVEY